ncbi:hypothetical protein [Nitrincola sp.]|uniref:hypothetical protein n=1 Tax=Nitrincola sp. TaxID=1926584 RepID=UPI003A923274
MKTQQRWSQGTTDNDLTAETRLTELLHQRQHTLIIWAGLSGIVLLGSTVLWLI